SDAPFTIRPPATLSADSREAVLRLVGSIANPASRSLRVSFSLPDARRARLELLDLSGRRLCGVEVGELGPGVHVVDLARAGMPPAGIYWVRLAHVERALLSRVAVIR